MKSPPIHYLESADYERRTGGWIYNSRLAQCLVNEGCEVNRITLPAFFETPDDENEANLDTSLAGLPRGSVIVADNLYLMRFSRRIAELGMRTVSLFHHPVAEERSDDGAGQPDSKLEQRALAEASLVVCTSELTARRIHAFENVDHDKIVVAVPGVGDCTPSPEYSGGTWRFLSVGAVIPRKRYEFVIEALSALPDRDWHWTVVGNVTRYPSYVADLKSAVRALGLDGNIALAGEVDEAELEELWRNAHAFLFSSSYEGYGMAVAEALRRGLPTITTMAGAVADWASDAVILIGSDEPSDMARQVGEIRNDRSAYLAARSRARAFGQTLPTWDESLSPVANRIQRLATTPS
jgi:glycosyltransferase involved in cell wall biosynthesis